MIEPKLQAAFGDAWADPRADGDFEPALFPGAGNVVVPEPGSSIDTRAELRLQFLAVYYHLNVAYRDLDQLATDDGRRAAVLERIERLSIARDVLEDSGAPIGFIGEPTMDGLYIKELVFSEPPTAHVTGVRSSLSMSIDIPFPGEDDEADTPGADSETVVSPGD